MPKAEVNGFNFHYQQLGQGPDLVMLHGLFASLAFWYLTVMPGLMARFRVTAYDLRGHGYSDIAPSGYTSADMANDLEALLRQLGVESAHLVGHSFGGAVALQYALLYPERVLSLTLADAWIPSLQPPVPAGNSPHWEEFKLGLRRAGTEVPENLPRVAFSFFEELARADEWSEANGGDAWSRTLLTPWNENSRVAKRWSQLVHTTSAAEDICAASGLTAERIRECTRPVLAIYGEYSGCLTTLRGLEENVTGLQKVIVPGVGHLHPISMPQALIQNVIAFAGNVGP